MARSTNRCSPCSTKFSAASSASRFRRFRRWERKRVSRKAAELAKKTKAKYTVSEVHGRYRKPLADARALCARLRSEPQPPVPRVPMKSIVFPSRLCEKLLLSPLLADLEVRELRCRARLCGRRKRVPDGHLENIVAGPNLWIERKVSGDLLVGPPRHPRKAHSSGFPFKHRSPAGENAHLYLQRGLFVRAGERVEDAVEKCAAMAGLEYAHVGFSPRIGRSTARRQGVSAQYHSGESQSTLPDVGDFDKLRGGTHAIAGAIGNHGADLPRSQSGQPDLKGKTQSVLHAKAVLGRPQSELVVALQRDGREAVIPVGRQSQLHRGVIDVLQIMNERKAAGVEVQDRIHHWTSCRWIIGEKRCQAGGNVGTGKRRSQSRL